MYDDSNKRFLMTIVEIKKELTGKPIIIVSDIVTYQHTI